MYSAGSPRTIDLEPFAVTYRTTAAPIVSANPAAPLKRTDEERPYYPSSANSHRTDSAY